MAPKWHINVRPGYRGVHQPFSSPLTPFVPGSLGLVCASAVSHAVTPEEISSLSDEINISSLIQSLCRMIDEMRSSGVLKGCAWPSANCSHEKHQKPPREKVGAGNSFKYLQPLSPLGGEEETYIVACQQVQRSFL